MLAAVLDTNVIVSGVLMTAHRGSAPAEILRHWRRGTFELVSSGPIIDEVERTLAKPYFRRRISAGQASRLAALIRRRARLVELMVDVHGVATHPEDDLVLAIAVSANADYLVTGDGQIQQLEAIQGVPIVGPRAFLNVLLAGADPARD